MRSVLVVFVLNGLVFGSWASRVPALADQVGAAEGTLGLALLGASVGMIAVASLTGSLSTRYGARVLVGGSGLAAALVVPFLGLAPNPLVFGLVLVALGASVGMLDVAMNIAAVTVIRRVDRPLMPIFHAGFSFGGLLGAAGAALAAAVDWAPLPHLTVVAVVVALVIVAVVRDVPNESTTQPETTPGPAPTRRPVLWLLAAVALCSAVAEGASADWSALFAADYRGLGESSAAFVYGTFSIAMAVTRLLGERAERRFGPYRLLVVGAVVAGAGLLLASQVPSAFATFAGFGLAGIGLAYAFPIALALAGAAGRRADGTGGEREIGFVTAIAYTGFLAGPPLVGGIAHLSDLAVALSFAGIVAALIAPLSLASREKAVNREFLVSPAPK
ncbi:MFS transporter [Actinokineospora sp. HUAS TT18]|uniref:MFS transporter n=1 Tax=Actinokineospora sp. HUAS TT18 TaxID=3447451 RepID=UPI003F5288F5